MVVADDRKRKQWQPGPTAPREVGLASERLSNVQRTFLTTSFVKARMERFASYYEGDNYIQHNPNIVERIGGSPATDAQHVP